jgi:hypothetical protein
MTRATVILVIRKITSWLMVLVFACGPRVEGDDENAGAPEDEGHDCVDANCSPGPLCGERQLSCAGGLGMGECIDGKCSPAPMKCVIESDPEDTCMEACARQGEGVICVENGCEGATAFGYPGPGHLAIDFCGQSNSTVQDAVVPIEMRCDSPLVFAGEGSFEVYQCCCDHPDF